MIEDFMLIGIGVLGGCLLMLAFFPMVHARAIRIATRHMVEATPMAINEIQADKDHLRAQFAMSVRKLEVSIEEMRARAAGHSGELSKQGIAIGRLHVELDKKQAQVFAMRTREHVRKNFIRRIVKILLFLFVRSNRQHQRRVFEATLNHVTRRA
jgi:hypothetical protein